MATTATTPAPGPPTSIGLAPAPETATVAEVCSGCRVIIDVATSSTGVTRTAAAGDGVVTESVTSYAVFSAFRVESTIAPPATTGAALLGCAITTRYTSTLAVPSSYPIPNPATDGWELSIASAFISAARVPSCGPSPASIALESADEDTLNGTPFSSNPAAMTAAVTSPSAPPGASDTAAAATEATSPLSGSARPAIFASIGLGILIGLFIIAAAAYLLLRHHRRRRIQGTLSEGSNSEAGFAEKAELPARQLPEVDGSDWTREAGSTQCFELPGDEVAKEKEG